jgi:DME family drug/metabolite transporter
MLERGTGPLLIALAALLWGTDSLYRFPAASNLDPTYIVFWEHVLGLAVLFPWIWLKQRPAMFRLGGIKGWLSAMIAGVGGGAIATVLFTASFRWLNPSVIILLQKLQPVFVILLAGLFLGERPPRSFYPWAAVALVAGFVLSFPDLDLSFLSSDSLHAKGVTYALGASLIWSVTTVAGRALLKRTTPGLATFWRYSFGTLTLMAIMMAAGISADPAPVWSSQSNLVAMLYLSFVTGLIPMVLYYRGMANTPASIVTFVELLYPVSAVLINMAFLDAALTPVQLGAGAVLLVAVTAISLSKD